MMLSTGVRSITLPTATLVSHAKSCACSLAGFTHIRGLQEGQRRIKNGHMASVSLLVLPHSSAYRQHGQINMRAWCSSPYNSTSSTGKLPTPVR